MSITEPATRRGLRLAVSPLTNLRISDPSASGDGSWVVSGYAATFNDEYTLYDGKWFRVRERLHPNALDEVMGRVASGDELVHLNHGHDMMSAVAATDVSGIGGLELSTDGHGFRFQARVDAEDPDAVRMAVKMRRGVVAQASWAFTINEEELLVRELDDGREDELYTILRVGNLYDVCVCAQGANPYTESSLRSLAAASMRVPDLGALGHSATEGQQSHSLVEGSIPVTDGDEPTGQVATGRAALLRAQAVDMSRQLRKEGALT